MHTRALVLFSGGQDSTTCLAWALERFAHVETVGFDYGQRHAVELDQRPLLLDALRSRFPAWATRLGDDHAVSMRELAQLSDTALTHEMQIRVTAGGLPNTFVPGRNLLFFTYAAAIAWRRGLTVLVGGMCETDYSGYPDCRDDTLKALQVALSLGMDRRLVIETPLMWRDKAATWQLAAELGGAALVELVRRDTHSCYLSARTMHDWGAGCGDCPACALRAAGWQRWRAQSDAQTDPPADAPTANDRHDRHQCDSNISSRSTTR
ncbi:MAG: 7-cyano-7-deazaguanine synthase QueC [Burkholderiaceae bacterium]|jgi:7-cyano-7-deazaguanine synthase|nr:7-cyano-7-deazaguanine synthase QueC [Burkholderiaceae bacterium]